MRPILPLFAILLVAFLLAPAAAKPDQAAAPILLILHDLDTDGYTFVGNLNHFGYVLLNDDATTNVHKNGKIRIYQNGLKLYETGGMATAHDYDALNPFSYVFTTPGPYRIEAEVPVGQEVLAAAFEGLVLDPGPMDPATLSLEVKPGAGLSYEFIYHLSNASTPLLPHSDALIEIRRAADNQLLFRTHTHTHNQKQSILYTFPRPGDYVLRLVGYNAFPTPDGDHYAPVHLTRSLSVTPRSGQDLRVPDTGPDARARHHGALKLLTTTDPAPSPACGGGACIASFSAMRLNGLVFDTETQKVAAHIDYQASLKDQAGRILFASTTLHEYDGNLEVIVAPETPGAYSLRVTAQSGDWTETKEIPFQVIPPVMAANGAGPVIVRAKGLDGAKSGQPIAVELTAQTLANTAQMHGEIEIQVVPGTQPLGVPILVNKLHTHGDGKFPVEITFPTAGAYQILFDVETIHGEPTPAYYYESVGRVPILSLNVAEGLALPPYLLPAVEDESQPADATLPGPAVVLLLLGLGVASAALRRRSA